MAIFLARASKYNSSLLSGLIKQGIKKLGLDLKGKKSALLKPNIVNIARPNSAKITHPIVVEAVIDVLRNMGIDDITVGDGPAVDADDGKVFEVSGYLRLAQRKNVRLLNFNGTESVEIKIITENRKRAFGDETGVEHGIISVPRLLMDADLYINIPKLKTHVNTGISISMKNQIGLLSRDEKMQFHLTGLHEPIARLSHTIRPDMIIVDGITGLEGEAPIHGEKKEAGILAMGTDMLEVDLICCQLMCIDPSAVKHIHFLLPGDKKVPQIENLGEKMEELKTKFQQPNHRYGRVLNIYSWRNPRSCPLCSIAFNRAIEMAKRNPKYWFSFFPKFMFQALFKRIDLVKGPLPEMPRDKNFVICFGDCAQEVSEGEGLPFVRGCPPGSEDLLDGIKKLWQK